MFQSFKATTNPADGPPRLAALRAEMAARGVDAFLVPRADAHQGEWVTAKDERLAWLTGFTGSAGFCAVTQDTAGVFIDGRYSLQVLDQIDRDSFVPVPIPRTDLGAWLKSALPRGGKIAYDPWLHVQSQIDTLCAQFSGSRCELVKSDNLIDAIWTDQPDPPKGKINLHPQEFAGRAATEKCEDIARDLKKGGQSAVVLTLPDSIAWLLNIRGADIARTPVVLAFAILDVDGQVSVFTDPDKADANVRAWLAPTVTFHNPAAFGPALDALSGPVRVDESTAPVWVGNRLKAAGIDVVNAPDPCALPKARKNPTEIAGARQAHLRDAVAMAELLAWLDGLGAAPDLSEIDVVIKLEELRRRSNLLVDISFETICGTGPNGAINHYRVTEQSNRKIQTGDLLLVDSGGQYRDGTTDITRTIAIGTPTAEHRRCFTRVLQGVIAISRARWPIGLAGRDLDPLARAALWRAGQDFDHGTGHGVGAFLGVHEGPQRLSRLSTIPFEAGMILSNEPGYYRANDFGIRIENLVVVEKAPPLTGADAREMLSFETLTFTPIDRNLIDVRMLSEGERNWVNTYHAETFQKVAINCSPSTKAWMDRACAPL